MNMTGIKRIKVAVVEVKECFNISDIVTEALINKGYDIDIEPINDEFHRAQGQRINVYQVNKKS